MFKSVFRCNGYFYVSSFFIDPSSFEFEGIFIIILPFEFGRHRSVSLSLYVAILAE